LKEKRRNGQKILREREKMEKMNREMETRWEIGKTKKQREKRRSGQNREEEKKGKEGKRRVGKGQKFENMREEGEVREGGGGGWT
jgi:hypothetical protein